ncbi:MAG: CBS domain-containing protein [Anaerolineales bacterium]
MKTVRDLLRNKGSQVYAVTPDDTVFDALKLMAEKNCGALMVMNGDAIAGIVSERDVARKVEVQGKTARETLVGDIMTAKVITVQPGQSVADCMQVMTDKHIRHLPVTEADRLAGVISIGDVVKSIITDQEFTIQQLEQYITGAR